MKKDEILKGLETQEDKVFVARILDKIQNTIKNYEISVTDFCSSYHQSIISPVLTGGSDISFIWTGGYEEAERKRAVIAPEYIEPVQEDANLQLLTVRANLRFKHLTHRDYLGSILGLGIKREKIGDIIVNSRGCQVIADKEISDYIIQNLRKVNKIGVKVEKSIMDELEIPKRDIKEIGATVSSLRLDAVAAAGYGVSRSKISEEIKAEKSTVNWLTVTDCSHPVKEGDIISIRGKGRLALKAVKGETKKGRISVILERYQ